MISRDYQTTPGTGSPEHTHTHTHAHLFHFPQDFGVQGLCRHLHGTQGSLLLEGACPPSPWESQSCWLPLFEEEFVAEENINYPPSPTREGENSKEKNSGTQAAEGDSPSAHVLRHSALTFDPSPPLKEAKEYSLLAPNDKGELMR